MRGLSVTTVIVYFQTTKVLDYDSNLIKIVLPLFNLYLLNQQCGNLDRELKDPYLPNRPKHRRAYFNRFAYQLDYALLNVAEVFPPIYCSMCDSLLNFQFCPLSVSEHVSI